MPRSLGWYLPEQLILKVTLAGTEPKIWRRVEVHSGLTLEDLNVVIECVFEWTNSHLWHFLVPPGGKLTQTAMRDAVRYHTLRPDPVFHAMEEEARRADEVIIGRLFKGDCKQIVYEYDFGDSWEHIVKIEKRTPGGDESHVPQCLAGENAGPPEDIGGVWGYYDWLQALRDEDHDSHEEAVEAFGDDFNPARFDIDRANRRLAEAFKPAPPKKKRRKPKK